MLGDALAGSEPLFIPNDVPPKPTELDVVGLEVVGFDLVPSTGGVELSDDGLLSDDDRTAGVLRLVSGGLGLDGTPGLGRQGACSVF
jgi:hypothetical protein